LSFKAFLYELRSLTLSIKALHCVFFVLLTTQFNNIFHYHESRIQQGDRLLSSQNNNKSHIFFYSKFLSCFVKIFVSKYHIFLIKSPSWEPPLEERDCMLCIQFLFLRSNDHRLLFSFWETHFWKFSESCTAWRSLREDRREKRGEKMGTETIENRKLPTWFVGITSSSWTPSIMCWILFYRINMILENCYRVWIPNFCHETRHETDITYDDGFIGVINSQLFLAHLYIRIPSSNTS